MGWDCPQAEPAQKATAAAAKTNFMWLRLGLTGRALRVGAAAEQHCQQEGQALEYAPKVDLSGQYAGLQRYRTINIRSLFYSDHFPEHSFTFAAMKQVFPLLIAGVLLLVGCSKKEEPTP